MDNLIQRLHNSASVAQGKSSLRQQNTDIVVGRQFNSVCTPYHTKHFAGEKKVVVLWMDQPRHIYFTLYGLILSVSTIGYIDIRVLSTRT